MLFGDGPKRNNFGNTGIGENNVDPPLHLSDGLVETIKVGKVGNISLDAGNVAADRLHRVIELLLATARDEDIGALLHEKLCRSQPNPVSASGDDSYLAFKLFGHCFFHS